MACIKNCYSCARLYNPQLALKLSHISPKQICVEKQPAAHEWMLRNQPDNTKAGSNCPFYIAIDHNKNRNEYVHF